jgi:hypothetical protein
MGTHGSRRRVGAVFRGGERGMEGLGRRRLLRRTNASVGRSVSAVRQGVLCSVCSGRRRRWAARPRRSRHGRKLPSLPQVALGLGQILHEGDGPQAPSAEVAAQGVDMPHASKELGPGHAGGSALDDGVTALRWRGRRHDPPPVR